jgi:hypothetical protein
VDTPAVLALCREHAAAEAEMDLERVLATLVPDPRFEYLPRGGVMAGWAKVERFYLEQYPRFARRVVGFELLDEWANSRAALQEYTITVADKERATFHVMSMMHVDQASGLLTGERLYCDEVFVRVLLGPLYDLLEPLEPLEP